MSTAKRILFPVDFSESCRHSAGTVHAWVRKLHAELTLLHCFEFPTGFEHSEEDAARTREALHRKLAEFAAETMPDVRCKVALMQGKPAAMVVLYAQEQASDLIMMPTRGETGFRSLLMGSVVLGVLHDAQCPVWTTAHSNAPEQPVECRNIVCAIDMGGATVEVLRWANSLKQQFGAKLHVIHSVPAVDRRFESALADSAHSLLVWNARHAYPPLAEKAGVSETLEVVQTAGLAQSIADAASRYQADLLVVGRGSIQGFLGRLRTNAHELIRTAPCPVLSV